MTAGWVDVWITVYGACNSSFTSSISAGELRGLPVPCCGLQGKTPGTRLHQRKMFILSISIRKQNKPQKKETKQNTNFNHKHTIKHWYIVHKIFKHWNTFIQMFFSINKMWVFKKEKRWVVPKNTQHVQRGLLAKCQLKHSRISQKSLQWSGWLVQYRKASSYKKIIEYMRKWTSDKPDGLLKWQANWSCCLVTEKVKGQTPLFPPNSFWFLYKPVYSRSHYEKNNIIRNYPPPKKEEPLSVSQQRT